MVEIEVTRRRDRHARQLRSVGDYNACRAIITKKNKQLREKLAQKSQNSPFAANKIKHPYGTPMELHGYFRSSASYRVRIALNLKGLEYEYQPVNLLNGDQRSNDYRKLNPQGLVPALVDDGAVLTQSLAIMEWLDEKHPQSPLLPSDIAARARIRALAYNVACDIQPILNLRILKYIQSELGASDAQKLTWIHHWIEMGFSALETQLLQTATGPFAAGENPGLFECCLIPQIYNAERFGMTLDAYPTIHRIAEACAVLPAFQRAHPENQPDSTL